MASGDAYRAKAAELVGKATRETDDHNRVNLYALAQSYLRLAEQADRNALTDVTYTRRRPHDLKLSSRNNSSSKSSRNKSQVEFTEGLKAPSPRPSRSRSPGSPEPGLRASKVRLGWRITPNHNYPTPTNQLTFTNALESLSNQRPA